MDVALDHSNDEFMGMVVYKNKALNSPLSQTIQQLYYKLGKWFESL